jgi:hypothetical protein
MQVIFHYLDCYLSAAVLVPSREEKQLPADAPHNDAQGILVGDWQLAVVS